MMVRLGLAVLSLAGLATCLDTVTVTSLISPALNTFALFCGKPDCQKETKEFERAADSIKEHTQFRFVRVANTDEDKEDFLKLYMVNTTETTTFMLYVAKNNETTPMVTDNILNRGAEHNMRYFGAIDKPEITVIFRPRNADNLRKVELDDRVVVLLEITTMSGKAIERKKEHVAEKLSESGWVPGLIQTIEGMVLGEVREAVIPASLAWQNEAAGDIRPHEGAIASVTLKDVESAVEVQNRLSVERARRERIKEIEDAAEAFEQARVAKSAELEKLHEEAKKNNALSVTGLVPNRGNVNEMIPVEILGIGIRDDDVIILVPKGTACPPPDECRNCYAQFVGHTGALFENLKAGEYYVCYKHYVGDNNSMLKDSGFVAYENVIMTIA